MKRILPISRNLVALAILLLGVTISTAQRFEAEGLAAPEFDPSAPTALSNEGASNGEYSLFGGSSDGHFVVYTVNVQNAGTYKVTVAGITRVNRGIYQLSIDGVDLGEPIDFYTAGTVDVYKTFDQGEVTLTAGDHAFKFAYLGRNAGANSGKMALDYVELSSTTSVGSVDPIREGLRIYPNPAKDFILLDGAAGHISIRNLNGSEVYTTSGLTNQTKIDISGLGAGIYLIQTKTSDGIKVGKFVKQ